MFSRDRRPLAFSVVALTSALLGLSGPTASADAAPPPIDTAIDLGPSDPSRVIDIGVHLHLRNEADFKAAVDAMYDPKSASFRHWFSSSDLARYAPEAAQTAAVTAELQRDGLAIISVDRIGAFIRARGAVGDLQRAFSTGLRDIKRGGGVARVTNQPARLTGEAGSLVESVVGLESGSARPTIVRAFNPATKQPLPAMSVAQAEAAGGIGAVLTDKGFGAFVHEQFLGLPNGGKDNGNYLGRPYAYNTGFLPHQLQHVYGMDKAYQQGFDGSGQTIVLLEAFGYPNILSDANNFNKLTNLPVLNSSNFSIVYPEGPPVDPNAGITSGWNGEIALDVQWAHAIAPGAKIVVVVSAGQDEIDLQFCMNYIIENDLGYVVSDSFEIQRDDEASPVEQQSWENMLILAASKGISFDFSTGDYGDNSVVGLDPATPLIPSTAPHATAVGGTSVINNTSSASGGFVPVGWGTVIASIAANNLPFTDPTGNASFHYGSGGGASSYWPKPIWQSALPGFYRQTPDVSAVADPYTGVPTIVTDPAANRPMILFGNGGTSLASPVFSAIWAIADQKAGHPLGQAAPTIAAMKSGLVDVIQQSDHAAVAGEVKPARGGPATSYTEAQLLSGTGYPEPTAIPAGFLNVENIIAFSFDTSLRVTPGWDNVTGYGTPYGIGFLDAAERAGR